jgi:hypothetical protein
MYKDTEYIEENEELVSEYNINFNMNTNDESCTGNKSPLVIINFISFVAFIFGFIGINKLSDNHIKTEIGKKLYSLTIGLFVFNGFFITFLCLGRLFCCPNENCWNIYSKTRSHTHFYMCNEDPRCCCNPINSSDYKNEKNMPLHPFKLCKSYKESVLFADFILVYLVQIIIIIGNIFLFSSVYTHMSKKLIAIILSFFNISSISIYVIYFIVLPLIYKIFNLFLCLIGSKSYSYCNFYYNNVNYKNREKYCCYYC